MAAKEEVGVLIDKLGAYISKEAREAQPEPLFPVGENVYKRHGACPGGAFTLMGNSINTECRLVGTEAEMRRTCCITLLLERKGGRNNYVSLCEAFEFEGFSEVLSSGEHTWLTQMPDDTVIGPAYDQHGCRLYSTFSVWRLTRHEQINPQQLMLSRG